MFFKKKKKLDSKVRFQHVSFIKKLGEARNYKRQARSIPEAPRFWFLHAIGLKTWWSQLLTIITIGGAIYLIYIPNFLFVKTITIDGASDEVRSRVETLTHDYFVSTPFYNPQRNLLFISKAGLSEYVVNRDGRVMQIKAMKRSFFKRSLVIEIEMKTVAYVINRPHGFYSLYNDGVVVQPEQIEPAQWLTVLPSTLKILDSRNESLNPGDQYFTPSFLQVIMYIKDHFKEKTTQDILYISVPEQTDPVPLQFTVHVRKTTGGTGPNAQYKVLIDPRLDLEQVLTKLGLLVAQTPPDRYRGLYYIDMRLDDKGFICLINAPCAHELVPVPAEENLPASTKDTSPEADQAATLTKEQSNE